MGKKKKCMSIAEISKQFSTGPKTDMGKLKVSIMNGLMKTGTHSKLMDLVDKCSKCPMAAKEMETLIKGQFIKITKPARCTQYKPDRKECAYSKMEQISKLKNFWRMATLDTKELQKMMALQSLTDAEMSRKAEVMEKGMPGVFTKEFTDLAGRQIDNYNKIKFGETHKNLNVNIDLTDSVIQAYSSRKKIEDNNKEND